MSFEDNFLSRLDHNRRREDFEHRNRLATRQELPEVIKAAHERVRREVFSNPDYAVQAPQFADVYGVDNVKRDMQKVLELKKKFEERESLVQRNSHVQAEVLEGIMLMHSELSEWLGNARTLKTSLYDDYINKTDMFAEWSHKEGSRVLAMGVDVTFSRLAVERKLYEIKREIDADKLGEIRYFKDLNGDFKGTRYNVPRVIIGVQPRAVEELAGLWMKNDNASLAKHPIQRLIVDEVSQQLSSMQDYARRQSKPVAERAYEDALEITRKLKEEKSSIDLGSYASDPVALEIANTAKSMFA